MSFAHCSPLPQSDHPSVSFDEDVVSGKAVLLSLAGVVAGDVPGDVTAELSITLMSPVRTTSPLQPAMATTATRTPRRRNRTVRKGTGDPPRHGRGPVA